ncbi:hypothetical protein SCLCIDRAFT_1214838 [Scleroderma citrinum Foug A]|uniref:Uncharacterized protein n=1 Tax=Scleroderma citrinum Foug A TaxID=1036808 RepID=A0A0C3E3X5_9AGAM|nr:hypothetical protein SCLCIDRAFT_1214838 [Scleroderma citrinum Foug A]
MTLVTTLTRGLESTNSLALKTNKGPGQWRLLRPSGPFEYCVSSVGCGQTKISFAVFWLFKTAASS